MGSTGSAGNRDSGTATEKAIVRSPVRLLQRRLRALGAAANRLGLVLDICAAGVGVEPAGQQGTHEQHGPEAIHLWDSCTLRRWDVCDASPSETAGSRGRICVPPRRQISHITAAALSIT